MEALSRKRYVCSYEIATAFAGLGEKEKAFASLRRSIADRSDCMPWLDTDPRLDSLRSDPRFDDLLRQVGFIPRKRL